MKGNEDPSGAYFNLLPVNLLNCLTWPLRLRLSAWVPVSHGPRHFYICILKENNRAT
jgi:hypothetical protein